MRVVVTGASRGIGLELVREHAQRGDRVLATCRDPGAAARLAQVAGAFPAFVRVARLDVADESSIAAAAALAEQALGAVDLLWSNAAVYPGCPGTPVAEGQLGTLRAGDGLSVLSVNAVGAVLLAQAFRPLLRRGERPRLVALTSGYGSLALNRGTPYWYGASKAALNMLHRSLAHEVAPDGVVVLLVSPGWVRTDMGGPHAPTPVEESVAGLIRVADAATMADSGTCVDYRGQRVPW